MHTHAHIYHLYVHIRNGHLLYFLCTCIYIYNHIYIYLCVCLYIINCHCGIPRCHHHVWSLLITPIAVGSKVRTFWPEIIEKGALGRAWIWWQMAAAMLRGSCAMGHSCRPSKKPFLPGHGLRVSWPGWQRWARERRVMGMMIAVMIRMMRMRRMIRKMNIVCAVLVTYLLSLATAVTFQWHVHFTHFKEIVQTSSYPGSGLFHGKSKRTHFNARMN